MVRAEVGSSSQPERLVAAMADSAITHGQTVRGDVERVSVAVGSDTPLVFFCGVRRVTVRRTIEAGDGAPLPDDVVMEGLEVDTEGTYDIRNALITSNGRVVVSIDALSTVTPSGTAPASMAAT